MHWVVGRKSIFGFVIWLWEVKILLRVDFVEFKQVRANCGEGLIYPMKFFASNYANSKFQDNSITFIKETVVVQNS